MNSYVALCVEPPLPQIVADPSSSLCSPLFFGPQIQDSQELDPDLLLPRARDARGRFAKGRSGNPRGRPRGIRNPRRRVPDLLARPLSAEALWDLLDRKTYLLRPFAEQLLQPPPASIDPLERLGIDLSSLTTVEDCPRVLAAVLVAVAGGQITPGEGARIAKRVNARMRAIRSWEKAHAQDLAEVCPAATKPLCGAVSGRYQSGGYAYPFCHRSD